MDVYSLLALHSGLQIIIIIIIITDLEKAYDTIDWHGIWQILRVYGFVIKLMKAVWNFFVDSGLCVQVRMDVSVWFLFNI